jgi:carboxyl-terminal processing protease
VAGFILGAGIGSAIATTRAEREETYAKLAVFARVLNYVQSSYVEPRSPEELVYAAIHGMVSRLDGHSQFLEADDLQQLREDQDEAPADVGLVIERADGLRVADLLPEGPAARAGLRVGDRVRSIDGRSDLSVAQAQAALRGAVDSTVTLEVQLPDGVRAVPLQRAHLRPFLVRAERRGPFGVLSVRRFTSDTPLDVQRALARLRQPGPLAGLVLDLRDNPGGLVEAAARVADQWLAEGVIVTTEARGRVVEKLVAHPHGTEPDYPVVVLVDGGTASAAEIVTAALRESGRAEVVGARTFGKGSVQTVIELEDGSALKLTIARHYTPAHRSIQGVGIEPDHPVSPWSVAEGGPTQVPVDHALQAALSRLRARL